MTIVPPVNGVKPAVTVNYYIFMKKIISLIIISAMLLIPVSAYTYEIDDALNVLKYLAEIETLNAGQENLYNLDESDEINIGDVLEILKHLAGLPSVIDNLTFCINCVLISEPLDLCPQCQWCVYCDWEYYDIIHCPGCLYSEDCLAESDITEFCPYCKNCQACCKCGGAVSGVCDKCGTNRKICVSCNWCVDCIWHSFGIPHCFVCLWDAECLSGIGVGSCAECGTCSDCCLCREVEN